MKIKQIPGWFTAENSHVAQLGEALPTAWLDSLLEVLIWFENSTFGCKIKLQPNRHKYTKHNLYYICHCCWLQFKGLDLLDKNKFRTKISTDRTQSF